MSARMELWNDYEGKTVDGIYPLERLLSPEGRSAFFATRDGSGAPAVMRLIESHFDEQEILSRWTTVTGLRQENLVEIERSGEAEIDGTKLVYALLEPTDGSLEDILRDRPLTPEETKQVGASVAAALVALHGAGLVHEHVGPAQVLAKGEVVKLRSDCVREAPEGLEGEQVRARDVEALAVLLHQALTQRRQVGAGGALPYPFEEMVRKGTSGAWGLAEMARALGQPTQLVPGGRRASAAETAAAKGPVSATTVRPGKAPVGSPSVAPEMRTGVVAAVTAGEKPVDAAVGVRPAVGSGPALGGKPAASANGIGVGAGRPAPAAGSAAPAAPAASIAEALGRPEAGRGVGSAVEGSGPGGVAGYARTERSSMPGAPDRIVMEPGEAASRPTLKIVAGVLAAVLLAWGGWHVMHKDAAPAAAPIVQGPAQNASTAPAAAVVEAPAVRSQKPSAIADRRQAGGRTEAATGAAAESHAAARAGGHTNWRVVAYTYNHEDQAQHKVAEIAVRHGGLKPAVFTPTGRAPYMVTLGGEMTSEQAMALRRKAWREGMPRDMFARNYGGR